MDSTNDSDDTYNVIPRCVSSANSHTSHGSPNNHTFFKSIQWSPDGTCIAANGHDNHIRTYVLPPNLLAPPLDQPHTLTPYTTNTTTAEPTHALAFHPAYDLSFPTSTLLLSSPRDHPIRLTNTLDPASAIVANYPLVNPQTERYQTPQSLAFTSTGTHFLAGSNSLLAVFDVERFGTCGPVERHATIPSRRKKIVGGGVGMKGIVSALGVAPDGSGLLAAGTYTRCVALYGSEGRGESVAVWSIAGEEKCEDGIDIGGSGVTQVLWSPCGKYLYVVERGSDGVIVYDVRVTGKKVGVLTGRKATTNQRMGVDVVRTREGHEVWAGGTDGHVRVWNEPGMEEGPKGPVMDFNLHDDNVSSAVVHLTGSVLATASGQRHFGDSYETELDPSSLDGDGERDRVPEQLEGKITNMKSEALRDHSLKIWAL